MRYDLQTFRGDLFGALTSTVVALPVALALGVASGMGAVAGLHGAIAVGFFAAVFGGTRSQISGPTAPMTVAMTVILTTNTSNLTEALTVVVLGGLLQMLLGLAKVGRYVGSVDSLLTSWWRTRSPAPGTIRTANWWGRGSATWSRGCWAACPAPAPRWVRW